MNKAYDRVEWSFLKASLSIPGFDRNWVDKIITLVTFVTYTYKVNGFHSSKLTPNRSLRQWDPLSPYIFILVFYVLSRMFNDASMKNDIKGLKLAPEAPALTHLFFADDAILFAQDNSVDVYQLITILNRFTAASGQKINFSKSVMIFGQRVHPNDRCTLAAITNISVWNNLRVYLSIPTKWGDLKLRISNGSMNVY